MKVEIERAMPDTHLHDAALQIAHLPLAVSPLADYLLAGKCFRFTYGPLGIGVALYAEDEDDWGTKADIVIVQESDATLSVRIQLERPTKGSPSRRVNHIPSYMSELFSVSDPLLDWSVLAQICFGDIPIDLVAENLDPAFDVATFKSTVRQDFTGSGKRNVDVRAYYGWKYLQLASLRPKSKH